MDDKRLFVGNLPWSMTADTLRALFAEFGEITEATVISDRMTGRSKGFGFVSFATVEAAQAAVAARHNTEVEGRMIVVNVARPKEPRRDFRPGGGYRG
jgi:RNA recognition motif-containing protein